MKNLFDSSVLINYFEDFISDDLSKLIESRKACISIIALSELTDYLARMNIVPDTYIRFIISNTTIIDLPESVAITSGVLKNVVRKKKNKFSLADSLQLSTAHHYKMMFHTYDSDFKGLDNAKAYTKEKVKRKTK